MDADEARRTDRHSSTAYFRNGEALEKAEITRKIRFYDIRHFYITHALAGGAQILGPAERVGHSDATMIVKVHSHLVDEIRSKESFKIPALKRLKKADPSLNNSSSG